MDSIQFNNRFQNKINILHENRGESSLKEYHFNAKENDPGYLSWLLENDNITDFGGDMTEVDNNLLIEFESIL